MKSDYFHWDHDNEIENEYVDVIGIVEDIEDKTTYNSNNQMDYKSVIRVVVRNKHKCIRISFWTDQMKTLDGFQLKKKEPVVFEDVRKKQSKYYDFGFESTLLRFSERPELMEKYEDLIPSIVQEVEPQNIKELSKLYEEESNNSRLRTITYPSSNPEPTSLISTRTTSSTDCARTARRRSTRAALNVMSVEVRTFPSSTTAGWSSQIVLAPSSAFCSIPSPINS